MSRYRSEGGFNTTSYYYDDYSGTGVYQGRTTVNPTYPGTSTRVTGAGTFRDITDNPVPGYFRRKKAGEVELHAVTLSRDEIRCEPVAWVFGPNPTWGRREYRGDVAADAHVPLNVPLWVLGDVSRAQSQVIIDAYARMNSPDALALVTAAEAEKTANMMRAPLNGARTLAGKILTRKLSLIQRGLTASAAAAQAWLEYRFGWKPLLYDIEGIIEAASKQRPSPDDLLVSRAAIPVRWKSGRLSTTTVIPGLSQCDVDYEQSFEAVVSGGVIYQVVDGSYAEFRSRSLGLSLRDVPSSLWELVPYSFVVDRFAAVGPWLQATIPNTSVRVRGSWVTTKKTTWERTDNIRARILLASNLPAPRDLQNSGGSYSRLTVSTQRGVNPDISSVPVLNPRGLSAFQNIDHCALILTRLISSFGLLKH